MDGKMSLGQLITYNTLLVYFTNPLENIINLQTKLQTAQVANNRLNEVYLVASEFEEKKTVEDLSMMKGDMTFKQVHYKYGYGRDVLSDINLTIPQGSKVAFVGISGSGKTTLAKMMVNFYDPSQGEISLGGVNLNQIDKKALRQYINYLPQQPYVFNGTILENLLLGAKEGTTQEDILRAVELAEISLSTRATVEPSRIIANIQSTSNQRIVANYLEENKLVKQGELLVEYQQGAEAVQAEAYANQLEMLKDQKKQLGYLQSSLKEGSDQFPEADKFGYQEMFRDYLSQASSLRSNVSQQNANISSQNAATSQSQAEIGNLISQTQDKIRDYKTAKSAIETGAQLDSQNIAYSFYQTYKNQGEEDPQAKSQVIAQVDAQITQLESSLATYRVQYAGSGAQQAYATGLDSQLESLKSQHLVKVGQELTLLDQKILEAESGKKVQGGLLDKGKITASEDGVLHLNPETSDSTMVAEGTLLAQLYPSLEKEGKTKLTAYLSSKDVARVKIGDSVRYTTTNDAKNQIFLDSTITSIDATATKTEQGNFFKIEAETHLTSEQAATLRYGLEGRLQMITGKKSYLRYFWDQFLNKG